VAILNTRRSPLCAMVLVLLSLASPIQAQQERLEYQVKAAFLFNFLKFVEWPATANDSPWVIGVLGHDPFGEIIDDIVRGKIVNSRTVEVRRFARIADVKDCNILFVGRSDFERIGMPVQPGLLTVGEAPGFLKSGGIINFYLESNRVHFEIRSDVARLSGLHVSAQLLKLGRAL
jgi:hypothetical protein